MKEIILDLRVISNELILAGKLQLKKLQKKKPEKNWYVYITCNMIRTFAAFVTGFYDVPEKAQ